MGSLSCRTFSFLELIILLLGRPEGLFVFSVMSELLAHPGLASSLRFVSARCWSKPRLV